MSIWFFSKGAPSYVVISRPLGASSYVVISRAFSSVFQLSIISLFFAASGVNIGKYISF